MQDWAYCCPDGPDGAHIPLQVANILAYGSQAFVNDPSPSVRSYTLSNETSR